MATDQRNQFSFDRFVALGGHVFSVQYSAVWPFMRRGEDLLKFQGVPVILNPKEGSHDAKKAAETPAGS